MGGRRSERAGGLSGQIPLAQRELSEELTPDRILLVEDDAPIRDYIASILLSANFRVRAIAGGRDALALLESGEEFEIILSNFMMPGMTGLELLKIVNMKYPDVPFVMQTAQCDIDVILETFRNGAFDYLLKPFSREQILATIRRALDERQKRVDRRKQLERALDASLELWGTALDWIEVDNPGKSKRVTAFTIASARALGISTEEIKIFARAAFLRDIGKLAGGPPSSESMSRTNKRGGGTAYCEESFRLLSRIPFLKNAAEVIYRVQEWYDGSGFPGGLRGEQIPLGARIIAIANAFEENAAPGNESKSASISKAREEIRRGSGSQFDPELVRSFLDIPENVWIQLSNEIR